MTDSNETKAAPRASAKIYHFPDRRRAAPAPAPKAVTVPWGGGWYHEMAIEEEHTKPSITGPAA